MRKCLILILTFNICHLIYSQDLVKDIIKNNAGSKPYRLLKANDNIFFFAFPNSNSSERLFKTNGLASNTVSIDYIHGTSSQSNIYYWGELYNVGNNAVFFAYRHDPIFEGTELWVTNGTSEGTNLLKDIYPGPSGSESKHHIKFNNKLLFTADNGTHGSELWITDGTDSGTFLLNDTEEGPESPTYQRYYSEFKENNIIIGDKLYFRNGNWATGAELWITDGTILGTRMIKDIDPGLGGSNPTYLTNIGNLVYFQSYNQTTGAELWVTDGTSQGTYLVKDIFDGVNGSAPKSLVKLNEKIIFSANDGIHGDELWISDGTPIGTKILKDILINGSSSPRNLYVLNNFVYFTANDGIHGEELWITDGTEIGTKLVKDINPNINISGEQTYSIDNFKFHKCSTNKVCFVIKDELERYQLWASDGSELGTKHLNHLNFDEEGAYFKDLIDFNSNLYFVSSNSIGKNRLWKTDGSINGTKLIESNTVSSKLENSKILLSTEDFLYFSAFDSLAGEELFKTDGAVTELIKDINKSVPTYSEMFIDVISNDNIMIFSYSDDLNGFQYWTTTIDTKVAKPLIDLSSNRDLFFQFYGENPVQIKRIQKVLNDFYFNLNNKIWKYHNSNLQLIYSGRSVSELCETNGKIRWMDTNKIMEFDGVNVNLISNVQGVGYAATTFNGCSYFVVENGTYGEEIWKTDGTQQGTMLLKDINPGITGSQPTNFKKVGNKLFFFARTLEHGKELWVTEGTTASTKMVKDIDIGTGNIFPYSVTNLGDSLLIFNIYYEEFDNMVFWVSNGTFEGTNLVAGNDLSSIVYPVVNSYGLPIYNNLLYFTAFDGTDFSLFSTNGKSINLVKNNVHATEFAVLNNRLYFSNNYYNGESNNTIWVSDGTEEGTKKLLNTNELNIFSNRKLHPSQNSLFFMAMDNTYGAEVRYISVCIDSLNIENSVPTNLDFISSNLISAGKKNKILEGVNVKYSTANSIILNQGFEAKLGSIFKAEIGGCINNSFLNVK